jgi:uncharacterized OsmC-like protein
MHSQTRYIEGAKFETRIGAHFIVCDQPVSAGGDDTGVTPPELLMAALGSCAGQHALEYLRGRGMPSTGLSIEVLAEPTETGRIGAFRVRIHARHGDDESRRGLLRAVRTCLVHNTLTSIPAIEVEMAEACFRAAT